MFLLMVQPPFTAITKSVTKNATVPTPALSKKYNSIRYYKVRESVASGWTSIAWIKSQDNLADLFIKVLPRVTRNDLIDEMTIRCALVMSGNSLH